MKGTLFLLFFISLGSFATLSSIKTLSQENRERERERERERDRERACLYANSLNVQSLGQLNRVTIESNVS